MTTPLIGMLIVLMDHMINYSSSNRSPLVIAAVLAFATSGCTYAAALLGPGAAGAPAQPASAPAPAPKPARGIPLQAAPVAAPTTYPYHRGHWPGTNQPDPRRANRQTRRATSSDRIHNCISEQSPGGDRRTNAQCHVSRRTRDRETRRQCSGVKRV